ncbi:hypothetical protein [Haloferula sp. BvORR071]|uniref:hypothetical protein n=1 Tax=Haloferula sp. BvORR071 TaxID=1396141 RepID=UPI0005507935|nr:hypothetical protein [Haloferula sp. BvORR071]
MTSLIAILYFVLSVCAFGAEDFTEREISESTDGLRELQELANSPNSLPEDQRIEKLGWGLRRTSVNNIYISGDRLGTHAQLRDALLAIPGHAEYYAERIREAQAKRSEESIPSKIGPLQVALTNARQTGFSTVSLLPSAESVRVLGEFLYDEEGRVPPSPPGTKDDRDKRQYATGESPSAFYALDAIAKLPIISPPVQRRRRNETKYDEDIESWRLWYEQIKAGNRTFRFDGDPKEYNLKGPVGSAVSEASLPGKSGAPAANPAAVSEKTPAQRWPLWVALGALAGVVVYVGKRKAGRSGI